MTPQAPDKWMTYVRGRISAFAAHPPFDSPPVHRAVSGIPPEILGKIFLHCLPPGKWGSFSASDAPWVLTKVCYSWREVALSTPLLWSRLPPLEPSGIAPWGRFWDRSGRSHWGSGYLRLLELHLKHSTAIALSLAFELSPNLDDAPFLPLITPHMSRAQHLKIAYHDGLLGKRINTTHKHFPLLESLELTCVYTNYAFQTPQGQLMTAPLEGVEFPWARLTQLTIQVSSSTQALALFRDCSSLEMCHLRPVLHSRHETSPALPELMTAHRRLRTLIIEDGSFSKDLLGRLVAPALSVFEFIQNNMFLKSRSRAILQLILLLITNSSAKLTSLTLRPWLHHDVRWSPQDLVDLSNALSPTITELDLDRLSDESLQCLAIKSDSPHGVLFPRLKRLVIRKPDESSESILLDMFYSRLYLAPNPSIIESASPLQHAELYTTFPGRYTPTCFGELHQGGPELCALVLQLRRAYLETVEFDREISKQAAEVIHHANEDIFPKQQELGYCEETSPAVQERFFQKLDAAFAALEMHRFAHATEILMNEIDTLMHWFSCVPETAFLHHPTYGFHTRATKLLEQWRPMLDEYSARDRWVCERDSTMTVFKLVYRRAMDL
ncbi:hypothetical protein BD779DRAFT_1680567 [Infundibulicybe gibba]|nr:hypothetical protein BD779DRAFT_1680567 [Infundibulicybe gibba]